MPALRFFHLILLSYDYNMRVDGLFTLSLEQYSQFENFRLQHIKMVNKTSSFKIKIDNNVEASRGTLCLSLPCSGQQTSCYKLLLDQI